MGFSRQEYWSGLPFPSPGDLPKPRTEPRSPALQAGSLPTELGGKLWLILSDNFSLIFFLKNSLFILAATGLHCSLLSFCSCGARAYFRYVGS